MIYFRMAALYFTAILVQWWLSTYASLGGISPQVLLLLTVAVAARQGALAAMCFGFAWGLFLDTLQAHLFGANAWALTLIGYGVGSARRQIDIGGVASQLVIIYVASVGQFLLNGVLGAVFMRHFLWPGTAVVLLTPLFNCAIGPLVFWWRDRWVGA